VFTFLDENKFAVLYVLLVYCPKLFYYYYIITNIWYKQQYCYALIASRKHLQNEYDDSEQNQYYEQQLNFLTFTPNFI